MQCFASRLPRLPRSFGERPTARRRSRSDGPGGELRRERDRLGRRAGLLLAVSALLVACDTGDGSTDHPTPEVGIVLRSEQSRYAVGAVPRLTMVVRNDATTPCAVPSAAPGSIEIVSVRRDGETVIGRPAREYYYAGMAAVVTESLRTLPPGASVSVPLDTDLDSVGHAVLSSSRRTDGDSGQVTQWTLDRPGRYHLAARVAPPHDLERPGWPRWCPTPSAVATTEVEVSP